MDPVMVLTITGSTVSGGVLGHARAAVATVGTIAIFAGVPRVWREAFRELRGAARTDHAAGPQPEPR